MFCPPDAHGGRPTNTASCARIHLKTGREAPAFGSDKTRHSAALGRPGLYAGAGGRRRSMRRRSLRPGLLARRGRLGGRVHCLARRRDEGGTGTGGRRTTSTARAGRSTGKAVFFRRGAKRGFGRGRPAGRTDACHRRYGKRRKQRAKRPPACGGRVRCAAG